MSIYQLTTLCGILESKKYEQLFMELKKYSLEDQLQLLITSPGGAMSHAFAFFDTVQAEKRNLTTIGGGILSSASLIVWLAGTERLLTPHTFILFHPIEFDVSDAGCESSDAKGKQAYKENASSNFVDITASCSEKKLSAERIQELMEKEIALTSKEALEYGLAHRITR